MVKEDLQSADLLVLDLVYVEQSLILSCLLASRPTKGMAQANE